jgi:hypothetical protein
MASPDDPVMRLVGQAAPQLVIPDLIVGNTYNFADIVKRNGMPSVMSVPIQYTVTAAQIQRLGVGPPKKKR